MKEEKLRIAMLSVHSSPIGQLGTRDTGGMSVFIREVARELGARGHTVDIFTRMDESGRKKIVELNKNVRLIHLRAGKEAPMTKLAMYSFLYTFFQELEAFRKEEHLWYDLIHSHYWLSGQVGQYAQKKWYVPHVITFHTLGAVKNATAGVEHEPTLRATTEKELVHTCHRILAATKREKEHLMSFYGARPGTIGVVPCGVNLDRFRPLNKLMSREQLGVNSNGPLLLYVGRFAPSKGTDRLIEAVGRLRKDHPIRLLIVGGDHTPEDHKLQKLTFEQGIQDRVTFVGTIEQEKLSTYYSAADILVVPSRYETFGLVALEALACGTPVVSTPVGAMDSILREGETGHIVTDGSPDLLSKGIASFISKSDTLSTEAIRESVLGFGWANVTTGIVQEYGNALRRQREEAVRLPGTSKKVLPPV